MSPPPGPDRPSTPVRNHKVHPAPAAALTQRADDATTATPTDPSALITSVPELGATVKLGDRRSSLTDSASNNNNKFDRYRRRISKVQGSQASLVDRSHARPLGAVAEISGSKEVAVDKVSAPTAAAAEEQKPILRSSQMVATSAPTTTVLTLPDAPAGAWQQNYSLSTPTTSTPDGFWSRLWHAILGCFTARGRAPSTTTATPTDGKQKQQQQQPTKSSQSAAPQPALKATAVISPAPTSISTAARPGITAGKPGKNWLLKPLLPIDAHKKCLILDLDETLVHSSFKPVPLADFIIPVEIDGRVHTVYVLKRPFVDEFLQRMGMFFEVVIFTASLAKYADPVIDSLDKHKVVRHRLFRESCLNHRGSYVKDMSQLGRELASVIIIDNSPASYLFHPSNAVPITSWFNDLNDTELMDLIPFLEDLSHVPNVMAVLDANAADDDDE